MLKTTTMSGSIFDLSDLDDDRPPATSQSRIAAPDNSPGQSPGNTEEETVVREASMAERKRLRFLLAILAIAIFAGTVIVIAIFVRPLIPVPASPTTNESPNPSEIIGVGLMSVGMVIVWLIIAAVGLTVYFAPTAVALLRRHQNVIAILVINLFLGWTLLGWVGAMVWAVIVTRDSQE